MAERTAEQMIQSACAAEKVAQLCGVLPNKESHVRELLKLGCTLVSNAVCSQKFSKKFFAQGSSPKAPLHHRFAWKNRQARK